MTEVLLHSAEADDATKLSNAFIDNYMPDANGEYVKIYIYLMRCFKNRDKEFSIAVMADALDHTQRDVSRALLYWEAKGLLKLEYTQDGELGGICLINPKDALNAASKNGTHQVTLSSDTNIVPIESISQRQSPEGNTIPGRSASFATSKDHSYTIDQLHLLSKENDVQDILFITESYLGHPLSSIEINSVMYWYDGMQMSCDLIEYLVEYCVDANHKSIHYMNKVAENWKNLGIETVEEAKEATASFSGTYRSVMNALGISGRNLSTGEKDYLTKWTDTWHMPPELIEEACSRTIMQVGRPAFPYVDSILDNWRKQNAFDMAAVKVIDDARKSTYTSKPSSIDTKAKKHNDKFHNFTGHDYDIDSIETKLLKQQ